MKVPSFVSTGTLGWVLWATTIKSAVIPTIERFPQTLEEFKQLETNESLDGPLPQVVGGKVVKPPFKYSSWMGVIQLDCVDCSALDFPLEQLRVSLHRFNLSRSAKEEGAVAFGVREIVQHPEFSMFTLENDVAVWKLYPVSTDVSNFNITYVRLDNGKNSFPGRQSTVIGWGAAYEGDSLNQVLQEVTVPIVSHQECKEALGYRVTQRMVCAGGEEGRDACQGDSGGPLAVMRGFDAPVLVGVVSWGRGCARRGSPGVYTRISYFRTWLRGFLSVEENRMIDREDEQENNSDFDGHSVDLVMTNKDPMQSKTIPDVEAPSSFMLQRTQSQ